MGLYISGQTDHGGALHSFFVQNQVAVGDVVNQHAGWEFVFGRPKFSEGIEFKIRSRRYDLTKIPGLIYNAREDHHEFYNRPNTSLDALVIGEAFINSYLGDDGCAADFSFQDPVLSNDRNYQFADSAYHLLRSGGLANVESVAVAEALVFETVDSLSHDQTRIKKQLARKSPSRFLFKEILCELHKNLSRVDFELDQISAELGVSKFHIIRTTKKIGGFTPYSYLLKIRLLQAREILLKSREPISKIALACGFDDASTFNKAFKRHFHTFPSTFRA